MIIARNQALIAAALAGAFSLTNAHAQKSASGGPRTPGFNNKAWCQILSGC
jgi:hypothetical protein